MEIIPIEYCDISDTYVHLHQRQCDCAFEHGCESPGIECPMKRFFTPPASAENELLFRQTDMPNFYFR
jgi:hypothetical protein